MGYFIAALFFCFYAISLAVLFKKQFTNCLPMGFFLSSLIMMLSAFVFKTFNIGYIINIVISLSFIIIIPVKLMLKKIKVKDLKELILTKGFYAYILCSIFIFIYDLNRKFSAWDEFSHWGVMIKEMLRLDNFYSIKESTLLVHKDYPPIIQVYELLFIKLSGGVYNEGRLIQSIHLFEMILFIPALSDIKKNKTKLPEYFYGIIIGFIVLLLLLFIDCHTVMNSIYTDYIMAIIIGYCLFSIVTTKNNMELFQVFSLTITLAAVPLIKQMGLPLYAMCIFLLLLDLVLKKQVSLKNIIKTIIIVLVPLILWKCWNNYIEHLHIIGQFNLSDIHISRLINIYFSSEGYAYQNITINNFINGLSTIPNTTSYIQLNYYQLIVISLTLLILLYKLFKKYFYKHQIESLVITLIIGAIGYAFSMLILYVFCFGESEGPRLASFNRYMPTFALIILALLAMLFIYYSNNEKKIGYIYLLAAVLLMIQSPSVLNRVFTPSNPIPTENEFEQNANCIEKDLSKNAKVYIIAEDSVGDHPYYMKYYLEENTVNTNNFNLSVDEGLDYKEYFKNNIYPLMKDYDYLYLAKINDSFKNNYKFLFKNEIKEHQLYSIENKDGKITFALKKMCEL